MLLTRISGRGLSKLLKTLNQYKADYLGGAWSGFEATAPDGDRRGDTAVEKETLERIGKVHYNRS